MKTLFLIATLSILSLSVLYIQSQEREFEETLNNINDIEWYGFSFTSDSTTQEFCLTSINTTPELTYIPLSEYQYKYQGVSYGDSNIKFQSGNNIKCLNEGNFKIDLSKTYYYPLYSQISTLNNLNSPLFGQSKKEYLVVQQNQQNNQYSFYLFNDQDTSELGQKVKQFLSQDIQPFSSCQNLQGTWKGQYFTKQKGNQSNCLSYLNAEIVLRDDNQILIKANTYGNSFCATQFLFEYCPMFLPVLVQCNGEQNSLILKNENSQAFATEEFIFISNQDSNIILYKE